MKKFMTMLAALLVSAAAFAQGQLVTWSSHVEKGEGDVYKVIFTGKVAEGYHTYTLTDEFSATEIMDAAVEGGELVGGPYEVSTPIEETDEYGDLAKHYYNEIVNYVLSYGVKIRKSWKKETIYLGRNVYAILTFKGKKLCVSFATLSGLL